MVSNLTERLHLIVISIGILANIGVMLIIAFKLGGRVSRIIDGIKDIATDIRQIRAELKTVKSKLGDLDKQQSLTEVTLDTINEKIEEIQKWKDLVTEVMFKK